jgi:hypothetical protein
MGNAVGGGVGKAAATMLGIVGGAALGDSVEGGGAQLQNVQRCSTQTFFENRAVGYNVVYEFAGKQYTVQLPNDPGPTIELHLAPVGALAPVPPQASLGYAQPVYATPAYEQPGYVLAAPAPYPGYYAPNYFLPFALGLGFGYWGGNYGHGHGRWR